jgi:hypothetical protein
LQILSGCDSIEDVKPGDAATSDVPTTDAGTLACQGDPPVMMIQDQAGNPQMPDWSCYDDDASAFVPFGLDAGLDVDLDGLVDVDLGDAGGDAEMDAGADAADAAMQTDAGADAAAAPHCTFRDVDFVAMAPVPNLKVQLFFNNNAMSGSPDFTGTTNANGEFTFPVPTTPLMAYLIPSQTGMTSGQDVKALAWYDNISCKSGETYAGFSITATSYNLLSGGILGGTAVDPARMTLVSGVRDCQFRDVGGGLIEIVDAVTGQVVPPGNGASDYRGSYFGSGGTPDARCTHTVAAQSLYAAVNVPIDHPLKVRALGRMKASDVAVRNLGERTIPAWADTIAIIRPYRLTKR